MDKIFFWSTIIFLSFGGIYLSSAILAPFISALILAYFFSPLAGYLENKAHMRRGIVAFMIVSTIILLFFLIWILLTPLIYEQITYFIRSIPKYKIYISEQFIPMVKKYLLKIDEDFAHKLPKIFEDFFALLFQELVRFIEKIWKSGFVVVNVLMMLILVPLVTFYFIKDWRLISSGVENLVPMKKKSSYKKLIQDINRSLSGFIRGQLNVCLVLAIYYATALTIIGLDFSIFIGITTGIVAFIPFIGFLGGFIASMLVAYFQFKSFYGILAVVIVFIIGNVIESILSPKLVGKKLGLHPVWIIFFVLLGGSLFGFLGMLFAIPLGAIASVLVRFLMHKYYKSTLYK
jgi:putative permease